MAFKNTLDDMDRLLHQILKDLDKTAKGNKAAAQRVRKSTIKLEKVGKKFRKESMQAQRNGKLKNLKKKPAAKAKKVAKTAKKATKKAVKKTKKAAKKAVKKTKRAVKRRR